jgi:dihydrofolate reductase
MRKLAYYVAATVDGFIAHEDGSIDGFLMEGDHVRAFLETLQSYDTVLMGRGTYDFGRKFGVTSPYPSMRQYVFSQTLKESPHPDIELVSDNAVAVVRELKQQTGKDIWLCGGSNLASVLAREGLIDEIVVKINPVVFGGGKSLFSGAIKQTALELAKHAIFDSGVVELRYRVKPRTSA